jgi:hypothetical protein
MLYLLLNVSTNYFDGLFYSRHFHSISISITFPDWVAGGVGAMVSTAALGASLEALVVAACAGAADLAPGLSRKLVIFFTELTAGALTTAAEAAATGATTAGDAAAAGGTDGAATAGAGVAAFTAAFFGAGAGAFGSTFRFCAGFFTTSAFGAPSAEAAPGVADAAAVAVAAGVLGALGLDAFGFTAGVAMEGCAALLLPLLELGATAAADATIKAVGTAAALAAVCVGKSVAFSPCWASSSSRLEATTVTAARFFFFWGVKITASSSSAWG